MNDGTTAGDYADLPLERTVTPHPRLILSIVCESLMSVSVLVRSIGAWDLHLFMCVVDSWSVDAFLCTRIDRAGHLSDR